MAVFKPPLGRLDRPDLPLVALVAAYAAFLAGTFATGQWLIDAAGRIIPYDYVNLWSAGRLALEGRAAEAYDYASHKAAEVAALGHPFEGYFPWPYPPQGFLPVLPFAAVPYLPSFALWVAATGALYVLAVRALAGPGRLVWLTALAWPAALWNLSVGQNGFVTTAFLGFGLAALTTRPLLAGFCFGLLTYKPHFGLLIPVALAAAGMWRAFATAAATAVAFALASLLLLGPEPWLAFARSLAVTNEVVLVQGQGDLAKLQTLYGVLRQLGVPLGLAWAGQGALTLAAAGAVWLVWRGRASRELKAATLVTAGLLATPYCFIYDLTLLALPAACLLHGTARPGERGLLLAAKLLLLLMPTGLPAAGFAGTLLVAAAVSRRLLAERGVIRQRVDAGPGALARAA